MNNIIDIITGIIQINVQKSEYRFKIILYGE